MQDFFSFFFQPGDDEDRIFAWLWPICVVSYLIGFGLFGTPYLWGFEVKDFSRLFMVSCAFGTVTTFALFAIGLAIGWFLDRLGK